MKREKGGKREREGKCDGVRERRRKDRYRGREIVRMERMCEKSKWNVKLREREREREMECSIERGREKTRKRVRENGGN